MTRDVVTVSPETSLKEVARILAERRISGVVVVTEDGEVVGVVSEGDILFKERGPSEHKGMFAWFFDPSGTEEQLKLEARTAGEAMTAPAKTIAPWRAVSAAAAEMIAEGVNRLPVVDNGGKLIGIVTRADLVRAFVRPDAEIEREIQENVLRRKFQLRAPEAVAVAVDGGRVTLRGSVDTRTEAELVSAFVTKIPGVVEVDSSIAWLDDDGGRR